MMMDRARARQLRALVLLAGGNVGSNSRSSAPLDHESRLRAASKELRAADAAYARAEARLVHIAERAIDVADLERVVVGVGHAVLRDPVDDGDVEVAGQHQRLTGEVARVVGRAATGLGRTEPELLFELAFHRNTDLGFDEWELEVDTRLERALILAEAQDQRDLFRLDRENNLRYQQYGEQSHSNHPYNPWVDLWWTHVAEIALDGAHGL